MCLIHVSACVRVQTRRCWHRLIVLHNGSGPHTCSAHRMTRKHPDVLFLSGLLLLWKGGVITFPAHEEVRCGINSLVSYFFCCCCSFKGHFFSGKKMSVCECGKDTSSFLPHSTSNSRNTLTPLMARFMAGQRVSSCSLLVLFLQLSVAAAS